MAVLHEGEGVDRRIWYGAKKTKSVSLLGPLCRMCLGCIVCKCGSQKRIVERDELHTREGATETKIGSV